MSRIILTSLLLLFACAAVHAQQSSNMKINGVTLTPELVDAYRDLAIAKQRLIYYRQVVQPQKQQVLENATRMTAAEILVLRRRLRDYEPFLAVGDYSPVRSAAEYDWLSLVDAEQNFRQLRDQEINQMRYRGENDNLYVYDVLRAALRVRAANVASGEQ